jgi:hypothetical protein
MTLQAGMDKVTAARMLAARHYDAEPRLVRIIHFSSSAEREARPAEPIKLLAVNTATIPTRRLVRLHFHACPSIPFAVELIDVTPDQYDQVLAKKLKLPAAWQTGVEIPKPDSDMQNAAGTQLVNVA